MTTIEKGMYVRTKYGIAKVENITSMYCELDKEIMLCNLENYMNCCTDSDLLCEPSFDVRDLIEVGDYVNGERVIRIYEKGECYDGSNYGLITKTIETENDNYETIPHDHLYTDYSIKTIVTKEQYEMMCYEVKHDKIN